MGTIIVPTIECCHLKQYMYLAQKMKSNVSGYYHHHYYYCWWVGACFPLFVKHFYFRSCLLIVFAYIFICLFAFSLICRNPLALNPLFLFAIFFSHSGACLLTLLHPSSFKSIKIFLWVCPSLPPRFCVLFKKAYPAPKLRTYIPEFPSSVFMAWVFLHSLLSPWILFAWPDFSLLCPIDEEGPEGLTQFLMTEVRRLREARKSQLQREQQLQARGRVLEEERAGLEQRLREQQQAQERCQRLREDWEAGSLELLRLKDENYMIAMRLAQLSEEKNSAVLRSRDLQLAVGSEEMGAVA